MFLFGGYDDAHELVAAVDVYDIPSSSWYTMDENLPDPRSDLGCFASGGGVVVAGGYNGDFQATALAYRFTPDAQALVKFQLDPVESMHQKR